MNVGDIGNYRGILCKFVKQEGGICYIETPHGTLMHLGKLVLSMDWRPLTEEEQVQYDQWVIDAKKRS